MIKVAHADIYTYQLPKGHRFPMQKYELLPQQLLREGILEESAFFNPGFLQLDDLFLTHSQEYWQKLERLALTEKEVRKIGFPLRKDLITRGLCIARGTLECARHSLKHGAALNIAGGTHHAFRSHGEGFCIFNDIAIAANVLIQREGLNKILIIDLDVHQGNGTARIFSNEERVFTCSVHGARNYPTRKERSDLDIGLPDGTADDEYLEMLAELLPKLIEEVKPELVFYLAGVDILDSDRLGRLRVSADGCKRRDEMVFQHVHQYQLPIAVSMGGGYSPHLGDIINAHANTYKAAADVFDC